MTVVEEAYRSGMDAMAPVEKLRRMEELLRWTRELMARQIRRELPNLDDDQIQWEVCLRMYGSDSRFRRLLQQRVLDTEEILTVALIASRRSTRRSR